MLTLAEVVRSRRTEMGLTQQALARRVCCSESLVNKIERGTRQPKASLAQSLDTVLHTGGDIARLTSAMTAAATPAQLPPVPDLHGRDDVLQHLTAAAGGSPVIALEGAVGVGKTALAVTWARQHSEMYPDGVVFADLHGHHTDRRPADPHHVLGYLLDELGVTDFPADTDSRARLLRSLTHNRRVLLILDNAVGTDHVMPLLCMGPAATTLVTSRTKLTGLASHTTTTRIHLPPLPPVESVRLLAELIEVPQRPDPTLAAIAVDGCGGLPLAIRAAAEIIRDHPGHDLGELAAHLSGPRHLQVLNRACGLQRAWQATVRDLPDPALVVLRDIGSDDGRPSTVRAVSQRLGISTDSVHDALLVLLDYHLVQATSDGAYRTSRLARSLAEALVSSASQLPLSPVAAAQ